jgi:hypothetical protein
MMSETYEKIQEQSFEEYSFGKAQLISQIDRSEHNIPPPLSFISYLLSSLIRNLLCIRVSGSGGGVTDENGDMVDTATFLLDEIKDIEKDANIEEVVPSAELRHLLKENHIRSFVLEKRFFQPWNCSHCLYTNDTPTFDCLLKFVFERDFTEEKMTLQLLNSDTRICRKCYRVKSTIHPYARLRSEVAYRLFLILWVIFIPLAMLPVIYGEIQKAIGQIMFYFAMRKYQDEEVSQEVYAQQIRSSSQRSDRLVQQIWAEDNMETLEPDGCEIWDKVGLLFSLSGLEGSADGRFSQGVDSQRSSRVSVS